MSVKENSEAKALAGLVRAIVGLNPRKWLWSVLEVVNRLNVGGVDGYDFHTALIKFVKGWKPVDLETPPTSSPAPVEDSIIRVDSRWSTRLVKYPSSREPLNPEFEGTGPLEYDVTRLEEWHYPDLDSSGKVGGTVVYQYLRDHGILAECQGLWDLEAINDKGLQFFRENFHGALMAWKSTTVDPNELGPWGSHWCPCLLEREGKLLLESVDCSCELEEHHVTLRCDLAGR